MPVLSARKKQLLKDKRKSGKSPFAKTPTTAIKLELPTSVPETVIPETSTSKIIEITDTMTTTPIRGDEELNDEDEFEDGSPGRSTGARRIAESELQATRVRREMEKEVLLSRLEDLKTFKKALISKRGGHKGIITSSEVRWGNIMAHMHLIQPVHVKEMGLIVDKVERALDMYKQITDQLYDKCSDVFKEDELERDMVFTANYITVTQTWIHEIEEAYAYRARIQGLLDTSGTSSDGSPGNPTSPEYAVSPGLVQKEFKDTSKPQPLIYLLSMEIMVNGLHSMISSVQLYHNPRWETLARWLISNLC